MEGYRVVSVDGAGEVHENIQSPTFEDAYSVLVRELQRYEDDGWKVVITKLNRNMSIDVSLTDKDELERRFVLFPERVRVRGINITIGDDVPLPKRRRSEP